MRLLLAAIGATIALQACSSEPEGQPALSGPGDARAADDSSEGDGDDGGTAVDAKASDAKTSDAKASDAKASDAKASDANGLDGSVGDAQASVDGAVLTSTMGQQIGGDPCSLAGANAAQAWSTTGRCNSAVGRTNIVSSQYGGVEASHAFTGGDLAMSDPLFAADGTLYVNMGRLAALDPVTLVPKWTRAIDLDHVALGPNGTLYAMAQLNFSRDFHAINPANGQDLWTRTFAYSRPQYIVLPDGTIVFVQFDSPYTSIGLSAITPAGVDAWSMSLGTYAATGKVTSLLASTTGTIYVGTTVGGVIAVSPTTHQKLWTTPVANLGSITLDERTDRVIFVQSSTTASHTFDIGVMNSLTGAGVAPALASVTTSCSGCNLGRIAVGKYDWLYVPHDGVMEGVHLSNHNLAWTSTSVSEQFAAVLGGDDTVYTAGKGVDGVYVVAFDGHSGAEKFRTRVSTQMPNTTESGNLLSIDGSGRLYAAFFTNLTVFRLGP